MDFKILKMEKFLQRKKGENTNVDPNNKTPLKKDSELKFLKK